jgi:hypothetical protein
MHLLARLAGLLTLSLVLAAGTVDAPASAAVPDAVVTAPTDGTPATVVTTVPGQIGRILFDVVAGQRIYIGCSFQIPDSRNATALYGPTGAKLAGAYCNPPGLTLYHTRELATTGTHSIVVDPFNDRVGAFTARVFAVPASPALAVADGQPVRVETTTPGQDATIAVAGIQGRTLRIEVSERSYAVRGCVRTTLTSPTGARVWVDPCTGAGVKVTPVLPASGIYLLRVDPADLETGGATFTVTPA